MENYNEEMLKSQKKILGFKLILFLAFIFVIVLYKFLTGDLNIEDLARKNDHDYKFTYEEFITRVYKIKEYLIALPILLTAYILMARSNKKWYQEQLAKEETGNKYKADMDVVKEEDEDENVKEKLD